MLFFSLVTVKTHIIGIFGKPGVSTGVQAVQAGRARAAALSR